MNPLTTLYAPEPAHIAAGRERQFLARQPVLHGHAPGRLAWLEADAGTASDADVREWDARVAAAERELMR